MYEWRRMSEDERDEVLRERKLRHAPWHRPPVWNVSGEQIYLITAACFEHAPIIGKSHERLAQCESAIFDACKQTAEFSAWCVLPNHYHLLISTSKLDAVRAALGQFHGRASHRWNGEDGSRGRKVWHTCSDRWIRTERHFWTTVNYVHNNPVRHGHVERWQEWPFSSAIEFLNRVGRDAALEIWREYPLRKYGEVWDEGGS